MGRELKRVPLDFNWMIGQIWKGFVSPYRPIDCKSCEGKGYSKEYKEIENQWYGLEFGHETNPHDRTNRYNPNQIKYNLTKDDISILIENKISGIDESDTSETIKEKLLKREICFYSRECYYVIKARLDKLGKSHLCKYCDGEGGFYFSDEIKELAENFEHKEPPKGEGYQLWNTTTEGHPMTPVFQSLELLCEYLEKEKVSVFGRNTTTKERWYQMLGGGLVSYQDGNMMFI